MMIFFWVFLLALAAILLLIFSRSNGSTLNSFLKLGKEDPAAILKRRFAEGEINKEEYEERKAALEADEMF